jgi:excisionase family DNA binding protein
VSVTEKNEMRNRIIGEADYALVVSPKRAKEILDCSEPRIYALLNSGELRSYKDGKSRKILVSSIHAFVERKLAEAAADQAAWRGSSASEPVAISAAPPK